MHVRAPAERDGAPAVPGPQTAPRAEPGALPPGVSNRSLARARRLARAPTRPTGPAHGTSPSTAFEAAGKGLAKPATADAARKQIAAWQAAARKVLLGATTAATGASFTDAIVAGDLKEIDAHVTGILSDLDANAGKYREALDWYWDAFTRLRSAKTREVGTEFAFNVSLDTSAGLMDETSAQSVHAALHDLPVDATWAAPAMVSITRGGQRGNIGGETEPGARITMFDAGMSHADYRPGSGVAGLRTDLQSIRHEVGHTIEMRLSPDVKQKLFKDLIDWQIHPWMNVRAIASQTLAKQDTSAYSDFAKASYAALLRESGAKGPQELLDWIDTIPAPVGDAFVGTVVTKGARTYWRSQSFLHSVGRPAELPTGSEFTYALKDQTEYVAELYAYAVNVPAFLAGRLSAKQRAWWKEQVFRVPSDATALTAAMTPPVGKEAEFLSAADALFTWEQLDALKRRLASP